MQGYLNLDAAPTGDLLPWSSASPPYRVSDDLTEFENETNAAAPTMIRMAHGILETIREHHEDFRWPVMGHDDIVFFVDNILDILAKHDHTARVAKLNLFCQIFGTRLTCLVERDVFSVVPLAKALANGMENCPRRYAHLNTAALIIMSCTADFGVNLSPEKGMHPVSLESEFD